MKTKDSRQRGLFDEPEIVQPPGIVLQAGTRYQGLIQQIARDMETLKHKWYDAEAPGHEFYEWRINHYREILKKEGSIYNQDVPY